MANINASALNSLQTRINAERSRRSLSPVTFTDGTLSAGNTIKATHFAELRTYTEGLNTLGSQTFNWSGTVSVGASITDVITQISNFVTTLEGEALASWHVLTVAAQTANAGDAIVTYNVPSAAYAAGLVRWKSSNTLSTGSTGGAIRALKVLKSVSFTPSAAYYYGGAHWIHHHIKMNSAGTNHFGGITFNSTNFSPMIGYWGHGVGNQTHNYPDQTPYTKLIGKGSLVSATAPEASNSQLGIIANSSTSISVYESVANHYYYSVQPFTSAQPNVTIIVASSSNNPLTYLSNVTVEAYY